MDCGVNMLEPLLKYDPDTHSLKTARPSLLEDLELSSPTLPRSGTMRNGIVSPLPPLVRLTKETESGLWATPCASSEGSTANGTWMGTYFIRPSGKKAQTRLADQVKMTPPGMWPTPCAQDAKNSTLPPSQRERDSVPGALLRNGEKPGGQLNADWVEWLMGVPIGWTDLDVLVTGKSRTAPISSDD